MERELNGGFWQVKNKIKVLMLFAELCQINSSSCCSYALIDSFLSNPNESEHFSNQLWIKLKEHEIHKYT